MKSLLDRLTRIGHGTNRAAVFIAQAALLLMMLLTVYSVIARYDAPAAQRPRRGDQYLPAAAGDLAVGGLDASVERHVSMEMLSIRVRGRGKRVLNVFRELVVLVFCGFLLHAGVQIAATALARNYRSTSLLAFPMWIAYGLIAVGALLLAIAAACKLNHPDGNAAIAPPSPEA